ncbi:MAG TPA: hypothetical protein VFA79_05925 [Myxococcales bacterium]|nr:hypothetical protein [Myxococcales bacterium]
MIALLLFLAPFVDAFWARDLGALHRQLLENPSAGQHALFDDLLRLATCDKLEKMAAPDPLRSLVRAEEARRGASGTIWSDLLREDFFRRAVWNPSPGNRLVWPDEEERWPDEVLLVGPLAWKCGKAAKGAGALALLTKDLLESLPEGPRARAAYERAVLLWRTGSTEGAAALDPALLPEPLRRPARFLRLEAKLDPPEGWVELATEWPELAIKTRAASELLRQRRHEDVIRITGDLEVPKDPPRAEMVRSMLWVRALSLQALGRDPEMLDALSTAQSLPGSARGREAIRALAMSALSRQAADPVLLERFAGVAGMDASWLELAQRALAAGNLRTARDAAARLQQIGDARWRAAGLLLAGEIGWVSGDPAAARAAFSRLFAPGWRAAEREPRDLAALQLAHAIVLSEAENGGARAELESQLAFVRDQLSARDAAEIERLLASLREAPPARGEQPLALGEVEVVRFPEPPPPPKAILDLPEAPSLLAIPAPDGTLRDWFDSRGAP